MRKISKLLALLLALSMVVTMLFGCKTKETVAPPVNNGSTTSTPKKEDNKKDPVATKYAIELEQTTGGKISTNATELAKGAVVNITTTPDSGYTVKEVTAIKDGSDKSETVKKSGEFYTFTMPDGKVKVKATFVKSTGGDTVAPKMYNVKVSVVGNGAATVSSTKAGKGTTITVTASPASLHRVDSISVNGSAITGNTFVMPSKDTEVVVTFVKITVRPDPTPDPDPTPEPDPDPDPDPDPTPDPDPAFTVGLATYNNGVVTVDKATAKPTEVVTITVKPNAGYLLTPNSVAVKLVEAKANAPVTKVDNTTYTFVMPESNVLIEAAFEAIDPNGNMFKGATIEADKTNPGYVAANAVDGVNDNFDTRWCTSASAEPPITATITMAFVADMSSLVIYERTWGENSRINSFTVTTIDSKGNRVEVLDRFASGATVKTVGDKHLTTHLLNFGQKVADVAKVEIKFWIAPQGVTEGINILEIEGYTEEQEELVVARDPEAPEGTKDFAVGAQAITTNQNPNWPVTNALLPYDTTDIRYGTFPDIGTDPVVATITFARPAMIEYVKVSQFAFLGWNANRCDSIKIELAGDSGRFVEVMSGAPVKLTSPDTTWATNDGKIYPTDFYGLAGTLDAPVRAIAMRVTFTPNAAGGNEGLNIKAMCAYGTKAAAAVSHAPELLKVLKVANSKIESDFTAESWAAFAPVLAQAQVIYDNTAATPAQIKDITRKLTDATYALATSKVHSGKVKVAVIGDSITAGAFIEGTSENAFPAQLQDLLGTTYFEIRNFGVSGRTMSNGTDLPYIKEDLYQNSLNYQPDVVIIALGTNDSKAKYNITEEGFINDAMSLVDSYKLLTNQPVIYMATAPKVRASLGSGTDAITNAGVNKIVAMQKKVIAAEHINTIDFNASTQSWAVADYASANDGVHPSIAGHKKLAQYISSAFDTVKESVILAQLPYLQDLTELDGASFLEGPWNTYAAARTALEEAIASKTSTIEELLAARAAMDTAYIALATSTNPAVVRVACIGDSITYGYGAGANAYPAVLQAKLNKLDDGRFLVKNYGVNGLMASDRQGCGLTDHENYSKSKAFMPNVVIIKLGTNDAKYFGENKSKFPDDMTKIIRSYQELPCNPTVVICTSARAYMVPNVNGQEWTDNINEGMVPLQRALAKKLGLTLIDINAITLASGQIPNDGIHGPYPVIAEGVYDGLVADKEFCAIHLKALIASYDQSKFTATSWSAFAPALEVAKKAVTGSVDELKAAMDALKTAAEVLEEGDPTPPKIENITAGARLSQNAGSENPSYGSGNALNGKKDPTDNGDVWSIPVTNDQEFDVTIDYGRDKLIDHINVFEKGYDATTAPRIKGDAVITLTNKAGVVTTVTLPISTVKVDTNNFTHVFQMPSLVKAKSIKIHLTSNVTENFNVMEIEVFGVDVPMPKYDQLSISTLTENTGHSQYQDSSVALNGAKDAGWGNSWGVRPGEATPVNPFVLTLTLAKEKMLGRILISEMTGGSSRMEAIEKIVIVNAKGVRTEITDLDIAQIVKKDGLIEHDIYLSETAKAKSIEVTIKANGSGLAEGVCFIEVEAFGKDIQLPKYDKLPMSAITHNTGNPWGYPSSGEYGLSFDGNMTTGWGFTVAKDADGIVVSPANLDLTFTLAKEQMVGRVKIFEKTADVGCTYEDILTVTAIDAKGNRTVVMDKQAIELDKTTIKDVAIYSIELPELVKAKSIEISAPWLRQLSIYGMSIMEVEVSGKEIAMPKYDKIKVNTLTENTGHSQYQDSGVALNGDKTVGFGNSWGVRPGEGTPVNPFVLTLGFDAEQSIGRVLISQMTSRIESIDSIVVVNAKGERTTITGFDASPTITGDLVEYDMYFPAVAKAKSIEITIKANGTGLSEGVCLIEVEAFGKVAELPKDLVQLQITNITDNIPAKDQAGSYKLAIDGKKEGGYADTWGILPVTGDNVITNPFTLTMTLSREKRLGKIVLYLASNPARGSRISGATAITAIAEDGTRTVVDFKQTMSIVKNDNPRVDKWEINLTALENAKSIELTLEAAGEGLDPDGSVRFFEVEAYGKSI